MLISSIKRNCKKFSSKQKCIIVIGYMRTILTKKKKGNKKKRKRYNFKREFVENEIELFRVNGD